VKHPLRRPKSGKMTRREWARAGSESAADHASSTCHGRDSCPSAPNPTTRSRQHRSRAGGPCAGGPGRHRSRRARRHPESYVKSRETMTPAAAIHPRRTWAARQYLRPGQPTNSARRLRWHTATVHYYKRRKYSRWARMYNTTLGWQGQRAVKTIKVTCALPGRDQPQIDVKSADGQAEHQRRGGEQ
jgi:hypothetical protein